MTLSIDLPDDLLHEIELRAVHEGRELNEVVVDLLREGLAATNTSVEGRSSSMPTKIEKSGLPIIKCRHHRELSVRAAGEKALTSEIFTSHTTKILNKLGCHAKPWGVPTQGIYS